LSVTNNAAERLPLEVGLKTTLMLQAAPGAKEALQLFDCA
jgi:hypothetical protein